MKPGATIRPRASKIWSGLLRILLGGAISATRPSRKSTSMGASSLAAGSMTRPPLISKEPDGDFLSVIRYIVLRYYSNIGAGARLVAWHRPRPPKQRTLG